MHLLERHPFTSTVSVPTPARLWEEGFPHSTGALVQTLAITVQLWLMCFDSTNSWSIFTVPMIKSCQLTQLRGNTDHKFTVCGSDFMTPERKTDAFEIRLVNVAVIERGRHSKIESILLLSLSLWIFNGSLLLIIKILNLLFPTKW